VNATEPEQPPPSEPSRGPAQVAAREPVAGDEPAIVAVEAPKDEVKVAPPVEAEPVKAEVAPVEAPVEEVKAPVEEAAPVEEVKADELVEAAPTKVGQHVLKRVIFSAPEVDQIRYSLITFTLSHMNFCTFPHGIPT
jgi:hypothetical protein